MNIASKQALMVYNPFSGRKVSHKEFPMLIKKLAEMGYQLTIYEPGKDNDEENPIQTACRNRWDAIFIAGGDGTVNKTIQLLAKEEYRPAIGIFPLGTSNEFANYVGISGHLQSLSAIKSGNAKPVDIGKFGDRYFANIAAAGWLSDITYRTSPFAKSYFGEWAYCLHFMKTFFLTKPSNAISVNVSTNRMISDLSLFLIMNGNSVGPLKQLIKNSTHNDGYFHLFTYKKTNRILLLLSLLAKKFNIADSPSMIQYTKIKSGCFTMPEGTALNLDGDKAYVKSYDFKVLPKHLHVFSHTLG